MQPFLMEKPVAYSTASKFSAVLIGVLTLVEYITLWTGLTDNTLPTCVKSGPCTSVEKHYYGNSYTHCDPADCYR